MRKISVLLVIFFLFSGTIFGAEGDVIWTRTYDGAAHRDDEGYGIAVDGNGNVYLTGYEWVAAEWANIWVRKYDSDGDEVWTRDYDGGGDDKGYEIAVDGSGNVYVTGSEAVMWEGLNIWVRKYTSGGDEVWTKTYNDTASKNEEGYGIAVDGSGNVYVTGYEEVVGGGYNIWVRKYDSDGDVVWTRTYDGAANQNDGGYGIAVDGSGNVYVTGYEFVTGESYNIWVRKYNSNGDEIWTRTHNGSANSQDGGNGIAVDGSGNVYVTGWEGVTGESDNIWVRKYNSNGDEIWTKTYNGVANDADGGYGIAVDGSGNVYVNGEETVTGEGLNIWVRKYEGAFGEHFEPPVEGSVKIQGGEKGYVNPLKGEKAKIHFQPKESGTVNVKIFTLNGLLVWEKSKSVSGYQDYIEWDCRNEKNDLVASGIYVVYVEGPGIKDTKKIAVLK